MCGAFLFHSARRLCAEASGGGVPSTKEPDRKTKFRSGSFAKVPRPRSVEVQQQGPYSFYVVYDMMNAVCMYVYIYIYICMHIYTYTYIYIYIYIL